MTQQVKKMPTPGGIGPGQTATVSFPIGLTYERFYIEMNVDATPRDVPVAEWGDYVGEIRLLVDGEVTYQIDAKDLVSLNKFYNQPMIAGTLPIFLSRPWMRTMDGEDQTAYGTGPNANGAASVSTFTMELELKTGKQFNSVQVYAKQSPSKPWGTHLRLRRYTHPQALVGNAEISDIPRSAYHMLGLHVNTDAIERAEVLVNDNKVVDYGKSVRRTHNRIAGRMEQTGFTHIDFVAENRAVEAMPMNVADFRLKLGFTATGNYTIYAESIAR